MKTSKPPKAQGHTAIMLLGSCILLLLPACLEDKDPSYEREALKLSAEKAALEVRLEESEKQVAALRTKLENAERARDSAGEQAKQNSGKIDPEKIKLGFAKTMDELQKEIELNFPHLSVKSWTVQKMDLQMDYPFTTGVMMTLVNKSTGEIQDKYWEAKGNTQGKWHFAQKETPKPEVARRPTPAPSPNPPAGQPTNPSQPTQPTRPKPASDGKSHVIDWGTLR